MKEFTSDDMSNIQCFSEELFEDSLKYPFLKTAQEDGGLRELRQDVVQLYRQFETAIAEIKISTPAYFDEVGSYAFEVIPFVLSKMEEAEIPLAEATHDFILAMLQTLLARERSRYENRNS